MTNPPTPRRYWAVTDAEGQIKADATGQAVAYEDWNRAHTARGFYGVGNGHSITEVAIIPTAEHARLLAIEAAARNALENSWQGGDTVCDNCEDCTVLDPKDAQELRDTLSAASAATTQGDEG